jgi:zinc ribbon protein
MPTYEYRCPNGHTLEDFQPMTASSTRLCSECPQPVWAEDDDEMPDFVLMTRVIGKGAGVIWKNGAPTRKFYR